MKVFHGTDEYRELIRKTGSVKGTAVALGKFDGIHLGHARLIDTMINEAGKRGLSPLPPFLPEKSRRSLPPIRKERKP